MSLSLTSLKQIVGYFNGKKSYIGAIALAVLSWTYADGVIDEPTFLALGGLVTAFTQASIRHGVQKLGTPNAKTLKHYK